MREKIIFYIEGDELVYVGKTHKDKAKHAWLCHINETRYEVIQYEKEDDEQETAIIPEGVAYIQDHAFFCCTDVKKIVLAKDILY